MLLLMSQLRYDYPSLTIYWTRVWYIYFCQMQQFYLPVIANCQFISSVNIFLVKSNIESTSEIDGFSTDEEKDEVLVDCEMDSKPR